MPLVIQIFQDLKVSEAQNRIFFGPGYHENDYVIKWPNGKPFSTGFVNRHFNLILKKHGLPHIRFHELRHSYASMLLNDGFTLKDVQEYMGHADIQMTADMYGHPDMARKDIHSSHLGNRIFSDPDAKVIELGIAANPWNNFVSSHGDADRKSVV